MAELASNIVPLDEHLHPIAPDTWAALDQSKKAAATRRGVHANAFKQGRKAERTEIESKLGGWTVEQIIQRRINQEAHEAEIERLRGEWDNASKHRAASARYQAAFLALVLGVTAGSCGTMFVMSQGMFSSAATARALTAPTLDTPMRALPTELTTHAPACQPLPGHRCPPEPRDAP